MVRRNRMIEAGRAIQAIHNNSDGAILGRYCLSVATSRNSI